MKALPVEESKVSGLLDRMEMTRAERSYLEDDLEDLAQKLRAEGLGVCRECYCTDLTACDPPCSWVEPDLCSGCDTK
jgi:hypothetical protein